MFAKGTKTRVPRQEVVREASVRPRRGREWQLRAVVGNVTVTRRDVIAWFLMRPTSTSFQPHNAINQVIMDGGAALAQLAGFRVFFRVTYRPVAARQIADRTYKDAVDHTVGPLPGAIPMLQREQNKIADADLNEKYVFMGVRVDQRRHPSDPRREVEGLALELERITALVAQRGLDARPCSPVDMDLLLRQSFRLGLPGSSVSGVVGDWDQSDLPALTNDVLITAEPWAKSVEVSGFDEVTGEAQSVRVAVLTMGRLGDIAVPEDGLGGWMQRADRLPFTVEWMATVDVLADEKVYGTIRHQIDRITDQYRHYTQEHHKPAPRALVRQNDMALDIEDQLSKGLGGLATRTVGWYRMAITGRDEAEIRDKVRMVRQLYGRLVSWEWLSGQYDMVREFAPGERLGNSAERRWLTAPSVMMALPSATAQIGDGYGVQIGETSGVSVKPMYWAPWADMELRNRSGLALVNGGLGSGKTLLVGQIVYKSVMLGSRWAILDPSGQLGRLCDIPDLAPYARHTNLLDGRNGELNPYRVLADPRREHFDDRSQSDLQNQRDWEQEVQRVRSLRTQVCQDLLLSLLPLDVRSDKKARSVIRAAVLAVPGDSTSSPGMVVDLIRRIAEGDQPEGIHIDWTQEHRIAAHDVYGELNLFAQTPKGGLVFGKDDPSDEQVKSERVLLHVYSLAGLTIPTADDLERGDETADSRVSKALFNLAAWLVMQDMYQGDRHERKGIFVDEGHLLSEFEGGEALIAKSSVDSRKHNCRVMLSSQILQHFNIEALSPLTSIVFNGNTDDPSAATDNLVVSGLQPIAENIAALARLTDVVRIDPDHPDETPEVPHRFLVSTKTLGQFERVTIYHDVHPDAWAALDTTPNRKKVYR